MVHNDFSENSVDEYHVAHDLLAFRAFAINGQPLTLGGLTYHQEIAPGVNVAQCAHAHGPGAHSAPQEGCSCGWYAYDERRHWLGTTGITQQGVPSPMRASGVVRLSGRIIVCERGLKAQYMEVLALTIHPTDEALIRTQFPDVEVFYDEDTMLKQYPLERLSREKGSEVGASDETAAGPIRRTLTAGVHRVANLWGKITTNPGFRGVLRRLPGQAVMLVVFAALLYAGVSMLRVYFPPGSVGGFGTLVPFGLMILLSPLVNMWRSATGPCIYLGLLTYGLMGSETATDLLLEDGHPWAEQAGVTVVILYCVPVVLLCGRIMGRFASRTPSVAPNQVAGPAMGGAILRSSRQPTNRLPKKVKSNTSGDGDSDPQTSNEGGQHG